MARIKIKDLPKDMKISKDDMRKITGGGDNFFGESETYLAKGIIIGPGPEPRPKGSDGYDSKDVYDPYK